MSPYGIYTARLLLRVPALKEGSLYGYTPILWHYIIHTFFSSRNVAGGRGLHPQYCLTKSRLVHSHDSFMS